MGKHSQISVASRLSCRMPVARRVCALRCLRWGPLLGTSVRHLCPAACCHADFGLDPTVRGLNLLFLGRQDIVNATSTVVSV